MIRFWLGVWLSSLIVAFGFGWLCGKVDRR
jgi:hypothetical protein